MGPKRLALKICAANLSRANLPLIVRGFAPNKGKGPVAPLYNNIPGAVGPGILTLVIS